MARIRQIWTTTTNNEQIVIPVCPGSYFSDNHNSLKLDITWGDGTGVQSIEHTSSDNTTAYALRYTFTNKGDHEVYMSGGWSDQINHSALNNNRLLAYAVESDRPSDTTPDKLKHWYQYNSAGGKFRAKLEPWQMDDEGNPVDGDQRGTELVTTKGFYLAGRGTFKNFTLMDNFPALVEPLYSADPAANIQLDPSGTIMMDDTFMNCGSLTGSNIWSFKSWGHRGLNKITSAARCFKNAIASVPTDYQRQFTVGEVTEQSSYINSEGETVIEITIVEPGVKQWLPAAGTNNTREVFKIWGWGMANCTDFTEMFDNCGAKVIDISRWDTSGGVHFDRMFKDCSFERLELGLNGKSGSQINISNAETIDGMFDNCQFEQIKYYVAPDHRNYNKNYPRELLQRDFPLLDTGNVTDFDNCFKSSNFNANISGWNVTKAETFENFRAGGALIDDHTPRFVYPVANIEVVNLSGNQDTQQMTVSLVNTVRWEWKINDGPFVQQTNETVVDLSGVTEGLNTLTLHAYNVADQLSDTEASFIWVLGFGDHCEDDDTTGTAVLVWNDNDIWDDTSMWQETGTGQQYTPDDDNDAGSDIVDQPTGSQVVLHIQQDGSAEVFEKNGTMTDRSVNNSTIQIYGNISELSTGGMPVFPSGGHIYFNGSNSYLETTIPADSLTGDFTIETWLYPSAYDSIPLASDNRRIGMLFKSDATFSNTGMQFGFQVVGPSLGGPASPGATSVARLYADGQEDGDYLVDLPTGDIPLNEWTHVAFTRESGVLRGFVNGVLVGSANSTYNVQETTWYINGPYGNSLSQRWRGYIHDFRVSTKAVYTNDFTTPTTLHEVLDDDSSTDDAEPGGAEVLFWDNSFNTDPGWDDPEYGDITALITFQPQATDVLDPMFAVGPQPANRLKQDYTIDAGDTTYTLYIANELIRLQTDTSITIGTYNANGFTMMEGWELILDVHGDDWKIHSLIYSAFNAQINNDDGFPMYINNAEGNHGFILETQRTDIGHAQAIEYLLQQPRGADAVPVVIEGMSTFTTQARLFEQPIPVSIYSRNSDGSRGILISNEQSLKYMKDENPINTGFNPGHVVYFDKSLLPRTDDYIITPRST